MVAHGKPCLGPVTRTGCGALCPQYHRDCYACYGPAENSNTTSMTRVLSGLGLDRQAITRRFRFINNAAPEFDHAAQQLEQSHDE